MRTVFRRMLNYCPRPAFRPRKRRGTPGRFCDPRFASFMGQSNRTKLNTDMADAILRGRKLMKHFLGLGLLGGGAWVLVESAKALSVF